MRYQRILLTRKGPPEVLQLREDEVPHPGDDEVLIRVEAAGVAFADVMMRHGKYPKMPRPPFTPGYDIVGTVEQSGALVHGFPSGTKVAALTRFGGYSQYIALPAHEVVPIPAHLDSAEAVSVILNYVTAYQMLYRRAQVKPGERILVYGAAGGVGTAILQLGSLLQLEMYGTASVEKHDLVTNLGAIPIDYRREDVAQRIRLLTGDGVDIVFDPIGGPNITRSYEMLRPRGRLLVYGLSSALTQPFLFSWPVIKQGFQILRWKIFPSQRRKVMLYSVTSEGQRPAIYRQLLHEDMRTLFQMLDEGKISPVISARLPLEQASRAHKLLEHGHTQGKIVLIP